MAASDGFVTLDGHVPSLGAKRLAETSAERVAGVRGVAKELTVKLPDRAYRDDTDIALAVAIPERSWGYGRARSVGRSGRWRWGALRGRERGGAHLPRRAERG